MREFSLRAAVAAGGPGVMWIRLPVRAVARLSAVPGTCLRATHRQAAQAATQTGGQALCL